MADIAGERFINISPKTPPNAEENISFKNPAFITVKINETAAQDITINT